MEYISVEVRGHIGVITMNRPARMNAISLKVLREMESVAERIPHGVRAAVLTGAGEKAFAVGADIDEMKDFTKQQACIFSQKGTAVCKKIEDLPIPVIAAVNGFALGGGLELALCCDIRLAAENAVFAFPETSLGVTPGFGGTQRLTRAVGISVAKELIYTGRRIDAKQAARIGLVNAVYPRDSLLEKALEMAEEIAENAPIAVRGAKRAINEGVVFGQSWGLIRETRQFGDCFGTLDQRNAMEAFLEKKERGPFVNR